MGGSAYGLKPASARLWLRKQGQPGSFGSLGWMWPKGPRAFPPLSLLPSSLSGSRDRGDSTLAVAGEWGARVGPLLPPPLLSPLAPSFPSFAQTTAGTTTVRLFFSGGGAEMAHGLSSLGGGGSSDGGSAET